MTHSIPALFVGSCFHPIQSAVRSPRTPPPRPQSRRVDLPGLKRDGDPQPSVPRTPPVGAPMGAYGDSWDPDSPRAQLRRAEQVRAFLERHGFMDAVATIQKDFWFPKLASGTSGKIRCCFCDPKLRGSF